MFDKITILFFLTWCFVNYGPPPMLIYYYNFIDLNKLLSTINIILFNGCCVKHWLNKSDDEVECGIIKQKSVPKYEDKYLDIIRTLNREWILTDDENNKIVNLTEYFFNGLKNDVVLRLEEINKEICELEKEINYYEDYIEDCISDKNQVTDTEETIAINREKIEKLNKEITIIKLVLISEESLNNLKNDAVDNAINYIINERIDKLKSCYVIEKTPIGNVLMIYDKECESFKYYADSTIPYRYLETVARKYVKFFNCRPIFVDMEEELRLFEEKLEKEKQLKKDKEEDKQKENIVNNEVKTKKNIFAKFKSYNKDVGSKISMAPPPKNSIPNNKFIENKDNEKVLLKERANRYTYEGKFSNFNFLQKVEAKVFNKKLGLTFAEFKRLNIQKS